MARRHTARAALVALEPCDRPQHWETVVHSVAVHEVILMETDLGKERRISSEANRVWRS